jgi:hypothetical protein
MQLVIIQIVSTSFLSSQEKTQNPGKNNQEFFTFFIIFVRILAPVQFFMETG